MADDWPFTMATQAPFRTRYQQPFNLKEHHVKHTNRLFIRGLGALGLGAAALLAVPASVSAQTETANLDVSAEIAASCAISTSPLAFASYDPVVVNASTPLDQAGTVTVTCTLDAATVVTLGQGGNADAGSTDDVPLREMSAGGLNGLAYHLYSDTGRATVWGNTAATGLDHTGTGTATALTVYGQIPAGQNLPSGSYTDVVVATVTF